MFSKPVDPILPLPSPGTAPDDGLVCTLIDHLAEAVVVKDSMGRIIFANKTAALRMGATSSRDLIGKSEYEFCSKEEAAQRQTEDEEILATGRAVRFEEEPVIDRITGEVRWVQTTKVPWRRSDGAELGILVLINEVFPGHAVNEPRSGLYADGERATEGRAENLQQVNAALQAEIAERRDLQSKLESERALLRTMIDLIPANIYAKDAQSRFLAANVLVARGMGVTPEELIGKTDFEFFPENMAQAFFDDEQAIVSSGEPLIDREEPVLDKVTGSTRMYLTSKIPFRDGAGLVIGFAGIGRDVTELKEAERRLASAERLESIGRLAAGVAHEINTPVQYVSDSVYFIREGVEELLASAGYEPGSSNAAPELDLTYLQENLPAALERTLDGLSRIAEIVRSMKEFSHADQVAMSPTDLNRAIQSTLVVAKSEYKYVATLETHCAELPLVTCHGNQINQVILNLVVNASHAIADRVAGTAQQGLITVKTYQDGNDVVIAVSDTGTGIPEAVRSQIFEPFFTTKEVGRGTGQGLSIARNVVLSHGGAMSFQTETGVGTTFFVRLPIEQLGDSAVVAAA